MEIQGRVAITLFFLHLNKSDLDILNRQFKVVSQFILESWRLESSGARSKARRQPRVRYIACCENDRLLHSYSIAVLSADADETTAKIALSAATLFVIIAARFKVPSVVC